MFAYKNIYIRLKFLYRKSKFITFQTRKLLVSSLIHCHFDYTYVFWYFSLNKKWTDKLQVMQNKLKR